MGQDGGHDRNELGQAVAEALQRTPVRDNEFLLDEGFIQVEVAPAYDYAPITGIAAGHVGYELLSAFATRKRA